MSIDLLLLILNEIGVVAFAISGAIKGIKHSLDLLGIIVLGVLTAIGGGVIRDVLLNTMPLILRNELDLIFAIIASLVAYFFARRLEKVSFLIQIFDALGLAVFTIIGAEKGMEHNLGLLGVIIMGTSTGVGGGMLRDILVGEIPFVLKEEIYASFAILGSFFYCVLFKYFALRKEIVIYVIILLIFIGRLIAIKYRLKLPKVKES
ncbi:MAG: trimeric intracellular cation channel family protein [Brevinematia bacterium]